MKILLSIQTGIQEMNLESSFLFTQPPGNMQSQIYGLNCLKPEVPLCQAYVWIRSFNL